MMSIMMAMMSLVMYRMSMVILIIMKFMSNLSLKSMVCYHCWNPRVWDVWLDVYEGYDDIYYINVDTDIYMVMSNMMVM